MEREEKDEEMQKEEVIMQFKILLAVKREEMKLRGGKRRRGGTKLNFLSLFLYLHSFSVCFHFTVLTLPCCLALSLCYIVIFISGFLGVWQFFSLSQMTLCKG